MPGSRPIAIPRGDIYLMLLLFGFYNWRARQIWSIKFKEAVIHVFV